MKELRQELMEAQKMRFHLIQWKLAIVAALGAAGLGLTGSKAIPNGSLLLCLIPIACVYADALIYHQGVICHVIGEFLYTHGENSDSLDMRTFAAYENFAMSRRYLSTQKGKKLDVYSLEKLDLHFASALISASIVIVPLLFSHTRWPLFATSGVIGVISSLLLRKEYEKRRDALRRRQE
jgi:hypothetical protein